MFVFFNNRAAHIVFHCITHFALHSALSVLSLQGVNNPETLRRVLTRENQENRCQGGRIQNLMSIRTDQHMSAGLCTASPNTGR
jgi:hypothetical protein